jgi:hypothetical protein
VAKFLSRFFAVCVTALLLISMANLEIQKVKGLEVTDGQVTNFLYILVVGSLLWAVDDATHQLSQR